MTEQTSKPTKWQAAIALGSNQGDSRMALETALVHLAQIPQVQVTARSPLYQTAPVGPPQPDFLNGCALLTTALEPLALLRSLLAIEQKMGRVRWQRWGPRLIDLDLLLMGNWVVNSPELTLPHPYLHERAFVLVPLADIAPDWVHPLLGQSVAELAARCDRTGVRLKHPANQR